MRTRYQRLLPGTAKSNSPGGRSSSASTNRDAAPLPTCFVNPIACERCRRKKAKCDGERPTCDRCLRNNTSCQYDADVGESRSSALKKKYGALEKETGQLRKEVHELKRLYEYIGASSEDEAYRVFQHIRASGNNNPIDALRSFDRNDFLTAEYTESPASTEMSDDTGIEPTTNALINVRALPWSVVASDQVVSELISQYFTFDYLYVYPPIHRLTFLNEMRLGNVAAAACCSPLLVNAICAQQCFLSLKQYLDTTLREELADRFLQEAHRLLQSEGCRPSLPAAQAICLICAAETAKGQLKSAVITKVEAA
ncbi:Zn(2)-C6 fungal-type DNA-binding domain protein [Metarhizium album ARSEF 1941]|uniref:Zn(2)-C6 fungal-type DNA-binding domain protein n=1 Tax=Metarhizium album (strain ARSEF 1941) TaxID=1081103 RepID=A0A0B2WYX9_METAS|nr:Zn(2)-C6 fungal-type DNA-binding domain protein [Metarhizium album ARSEF 1941]KHO01502.1 Zn(2)-C6 fungal-type DNA-binding domain protein [Metarhizium album ARSEF 1941]